MTGKRVPFPQYQRGEAVLTQNAGHLRPRIAAPGHGCGATLASHHPGHLLWPDDAPEATTGAPRISRTRLPLPDERQRHAAPSRHRAFGARILG
ncbi:hypothetical protein SGR_2059 [Streptomyces griseus subsp. griseus NBRC 13350]|uniref:Uncharacterized protein n=1 Tax=Streptomyces griseus subsp. griseus (strain JCM 4626 / CBS 651.72 / NBRC 13350 / KCC S-0626 / ISP 5235) TaxID=455632 RepID=B1VZZ9_STRGG|nr:hypothetical protein SGR_2059 [Streptomyces griseus subsp. griseus NBRC 13350]